MGQAKLRGTKEERIANAILQDPMQMREWSRRLFDGITTPTTINAQVSDFVAMLKAAEHTTGDPIFLDCQPESWARHGCCDLNVDKYIKANGGHPVCGYRIWYKAPTYIEGERHVVWSDGLQLRDVSFSIDGEKLILFVPDDKSFDDRPDKIRHAFNSADARVLLRYEAREQEQRQRLPPRSSAKAWKNQISYAQWLQGR